MGHRDSLLVTRQYTTPKCRYETLTRSVCLLGFVHVGLSETGFLEFPSSYGRITPKTAEAVRHRETRSIWEMARASKLTHYRLNQTAVSPPSTVKMPPTQ